ncbi:NAD(P)/FAD-dependent oxidoreductase [Granulosicoccus antarcticus]|uniref:NAD(P)/FAD-dependent oxidoreductase n=1 Tax=Granulosicoccus antarcticus TaxID=437505 RepID=UPI00197AE1CA|nr:FAD-binding oxidoreductase [Granulosicoccus antarcticus]
MFTDDFKTTPYWWEQSPPQQSGEADLPCAVDVLIIGSGYTGLHAALQTARGGMHTLVLDSQALGAGCSTRNGGQISLGVKPCLTTLTKRFGADKAMAIRCTGEQAMNYVADFISVENIECDYAKVGRFLGAHNQRSFNELARELSAPLRKGDEQDGYLVAKSEVHHEVCTDIYAGGAVYPHHASLDPGKYHSALLKKVISAGATAVSHVTVSKIERSGEGYLVHTGQRTVKAKKVIVATNGYTNKALSWHRRRVIPIGSYIIATEELPTELVNQLIPTNRNICDTRKVVYYYRASPDKKRILFGGRVSLQETDTRASALKLRAEMIRIFPQLESAKISHSWMGYVAFTFDKLMRAGGENGLYHAMGYCGSGIGFSSYLGMRTGLKALGHEEGATPFDSLPFSSRPLYYGHPWFLAPSLAYYKLRDRFL